MEEKQVLVDHERCIGCRHCELACALEHSSSKDIFSAIFEEPMPVKRIFVDAVSDLTTFPGKCRHCEIPFCVSVCPTKAMVKDERNGLVVADGSLCIGCGMCGLACPFGVIVYVRRNGRKVAVKCDGCSERVSSGGVPACVEACKTGALSFTTWDGFSRGKRLEVAGRMTFPVATPEVSQGISEGVSLWRGMLKTMVELKAREV